MGHNLYEKRRYAMDTNRAARSKRPHQESEIRFTAKDLEDVTIPHHDPLVVSPIIQRRDGGFSKVARVLMDTGASIDILY